MPLLPNTVASENMAAEFASDSIANILHISRLLSAARKFVTALCNKLEHALRRICSFVTGLPLTPQKSRIHYPNHCLLSEHSQHAVVLPNRRESPVEE